MIKPAVLTDNVIEYKGIVITSWQFVSPWVPVWGEYSQTYSPYFDIYNDLNSGRYSIYLEYDYNNTGTWQDCIYLDGTTGWHSLDIVDWQTFNSHWDVTANGELDKTDSCKLRIRIRFNPAYYNSDSRAVSDYAYSGLLAIDPNYTFALRAIISNTIKCWIPSSGPDIPYNLITHKAGVYSSTNFSSRVSIYRAAQAKKSFENITFPALTGADIDSLFEFLEFVTYCKSQFEMILCSELDFSNVQIYGNYKSVPVKLSNPDLTITPIGNDYYSTTLNLIGV